MPIQHETDLYMPVKTFLEQQGYTVRGEVKNCDLVAVRGEEPPVIVELKKTFNLPLLIQAIDRLAHTPNVYMAVEMPDHGRAPHGLGWNDLVRLTRMLGLGLMTVRFYKSRKPRVDMMCDPTPYTPRKSALKTAMLLREFKERSGDYNVGGSTRRKLVTAYREKSLQLAYLLKTHGPLSTRQLREQTANPKATTMLQDNYYGWFERVERGTYKLTARGAAELGDFAHVIGDSPSGT
ncbi:DUF2161 domain-containing phosphodiesterase [Paenibacillus sp. MBLB4367]|uniref:DUF2161 domain-containing phosphodiesterase n=1 Tax=Paenibacillus sp. MBLB4367 TaxID=3384767 RepID=UPI003908105E